jgi:hypothetical protein
MKTRDGAPMRARMLRVLGSALIVAVSAAPIAAAGPLAGVTNLPIAAAGAPASAVCPVAPDPSALPSVAELRSQEALLSGLGVRPTGSPAQSAYIAWIERNLRTIHGVTTTEQHFTINRWTEHSESLTLTVGGHTESLPVAAPVPTRSPPALPA